MSTPNPRPFAGRKMSRRERRASERRARERADRLARSMPPPEKTERTDPISGRPMYSGEPAPAPFTAPPRTAATPPHPSSSSPAPGRPFVRPATAPSPAAGTAAASTNPGSAAHPAPQWARPAPVTTPKPSRTRTRRTKSPRAAKPASATSARPLPPLPVPGAGSQTATTPSVLQRLLEPVEAPAARWVLGAGATTATVSVLAAIGAGLPVLGHTADWLYLGAGAAGAAAGAYLVWIGFGATSLRLRAACATLSVLVVTAFVAGLVADPVLIDGRVLVATSKEARSTKLADGVYQDLRRMARLDDLLIAPIEDARANVSLYEPATNELAEMSVEYKRIPASDLPDPSFAVVISQMKVAAYWGSKAMATKTQLIEQDDAKASSDLETQRATFTNNWMTAAASLKQVAAALDIPYTTDLEGPHE